MERLPFGLASCPAAAKRAGCLAAGIEIHAPDARPMEINAAFILAALGDQQHGRERFPLPSVEAGGNHLGGWVAEVCRRPLRRTPAIRAEREIGNEVADFGRTIMRQVRPLRHVTREGLIELSVAKLAQLAMRNPAQRLTLILDDGVDTEVEVVIRPMQDRSRSTSSGRASNAKAAKRRTEIDVPREGTSPRCAGVTQEGLGGARRSARRHSGRAATNT